MFNSTRIEKGGAIDETATNADREVSSVCCGRRWVSLELPDEPEVKDNKERYFSKLMLRSILIRNERSPLMKWFRIALEVIGAAAILGVVLIGARIMYSGSDKVDKASRKDVTNILTASGLSPDQNFRVISSYESSRTFTGDHLDYFCIELPDFRVAEWAKDEWRDGPETDPVLADALQLAINDARQQGGGCIPSAEEARSKGFKLMLTEVFLRNRKAYVVDVVLYDPQKKQLYYVSFKT